MVVAAAAATILIIALPGLSFAYRNGDLHIALETTASLVAAIAALLVFGRYRRSQMLGELFLFVALCMLAIANAVWAITPSAVDTLEAEAVWAPLWTGLLAAAGLAAAAFVRQRPIHRRGLAPMLMLCSGAAIGGVILAAVLLGPDLETGIDPDILPVSSASPQITGAPGLLACQLVAMLLSIAASVGFTLGAKREGDELFGWLALAATLAAFSRLNYFLFPSGYSEWVFTGDFFRLGAYMLILVGAARQVFAYERSAGELAVLEERQRIARDLHDGLAQDLAFISMQASELGQEEKRARQIGVAANRALADSRGAIAALSSSRDEALDISVARLATALTHRSDVRVELELAAGIEASYERRDALLRILSESISNAVRHGSPSALSVELRSRPGLRRAGVRLTIVDDGAGFDPAEASRSGGLGLAGMRKRAERLGGTVAVTSQPGAGVKVEVALP